MGSLNRIFDLAAKALDSSGSSSSARGGSRDWRSMVRDVAGAVTGDGKPATPAPAPGGQMPHPSQPPAHHAAPGVGLTPPPAAGSWATAGAAAATPAAPAGSAPTAADRAAIARYEYLLQTSDPHQVEAIHREAFARLTPQQRAQVQAGMRSELRPAEQPRTADAPDLARAAARTEALRPGTMAGLLARVGRSRSGSGGGLGRSAALVGAGGVLGAVAGAAVVSTVAAPILAQAVTSGIDFDAIASGVDLDAIAGGVDLGAAGDFVSGAGETVSGLGDQLSNFELPGLGDFFGN